MRTLCVFGSEKTSEIHVGGSIDSLSSLLPECRTVIVTDRTVSAIYGSRFPDCEIIEIGEGEESKTLETVSMIYDRLISLEADRSVFMLGIGGGIVCDVTGFAASTYLRGVRFAYCPTTLLSQVDASVGGKTGVNFRGYKNMAGVFSQPEFVVCDPTVLKSLPARELACGFAEAVKHAAVSDIHYFDFLERERGKALALDSGVMERVVYDSVAVKAGIVSRDEREKGERRKLNFGHTFGHALEKTKGLSHGEAVSIGMMLAAKISEKRGMLDKASVSRLRALLEGFYLPVSVRADAEGIMDAVLHDKKREGDSLHFVLLQELGSAAAVKVPAAELRVFVHEEFD